MKKTEKRAWYSTENKYNTEQRCEKLFLSHLWPDGIKCPKCGRYNPITNKIHANTQKTHVKFKCPHCGKQITEKIDCIFTGSSLSFKKWFKAVYCIAIQDDSAASTEFIELLEITQKTAWNLFIRISQLAEQDIKLSGEVEIDEWYESGKPEYKHNYHQSSHADTLNRLRFLGLIVHHMARGAGNADCRVRALNHLSESGVLSVEMFRRGHHDEKLTSC